MTSRLFLPILEATPAQVLAHSPGSLEGLCAAVQGLRKSCHGSHHAAQLPGLNLASESLQEAVRVPSDLLGSQVPPQSPLFLQRGAPGHQCCSHGLWVPSTRTGPGHVTKAPEAAPPCPGPRLERICLSAPLSFLSPPGSALAQFLLLGPGSLPEKPLFLFLPKPAVAGALSPLGSAGSLCL